jgi:hypothetical protein
MSDERQIKMLKTSPEAPSSILLVGKFGLGLHPRAFVTPYWFSREYNISQKKTSIRSKVLVPMHQYLQSLVSYKN